MPSRRLVLAVFGVLVLAAACGDDNTVQPAPAIEKSAAIAQGDAICKQLDIDDKALIEQFKTEHPAPSVADVRDFFVTVLLPRYDRAVGDIHRLGEPTKDRTEFDKAVLALDEGLSAVKVEVAADPIKVLNSGTTAFDEANKRFTEYGFTECGKP